MKTSQVNESLIGRKVKGIENGYNVTGTIIGIVENEHSKGVKIQLDEPLVCWSGDFNCLGEGSLELIKRIVKESEKRTRTKMVNTYFGEE